MNMLLEVYNPSCELKDLMCLTQFDPGCIHFHNSLAAEGSQATRLTFKLYESNKPISPKVRQVLNMAGLACRSGVKTSTKGNRKRKQDCLVDFEFGEECPNANLSGA
jgi:hypothetical protein